MVTTNEKEPANSALCSTWSEAFRKAADGERCRPDCVVEGL